MTALGRSWWILAARGALAVMFGLAVLTWPSITLGELVLAFGAYAFIDGLGAIACALRVAALSRAGWPLVAEGVVSSALGVIAWVSPLIPWALLYLIASWGVITGVLELVAAARLREEITNQWLLGLSGASSVLLGLLILAIPAAGTIHVVRAIGIYAAVFGALLLGAAIRLRGWPPVRLMQMTR